MFKSLDIPQLEAQVRTIDALLASIERGEGPVGKFVGSDEIYVTLRDRIGALHNAMHEATATTGAVGQLLYTDQMYQRIRAPILKVDQALAAIQSGQGTAGQLLRDNAQYDRARDAIQGVRKSIEGLHASAFVQSDKLYNDWTRSIAGLSRQVDAINTNPLLLTSEMYDNLNGAAKEVSHAIREFREDPRKFLRLKLF
jgi:phospholipid/cholesterol/gamma-HCH transport system substrate-binding protein